MKKLFLISISLILISSVSNASEAVKDAAVPQSTPAVATGSATAEVVKTTEDAAKAEVKDYKDAAKAEIQSYENYIKQIAEFEKSDKFNPKLLEENLPLEIHLGDANAPVKMVEYASLGCIHCKQFHTEVFYKLKKDYIDTGKVHFKFRQYPLNAPALKAALVMSCVEEKDRTAYIGAMFDSQAQWAYSKSEADLKDKLKTMSKIVGVPSDAFEKCYNDEATQNTIVTNMKRAYDELMVTSTPGIFVQGKRLLDSRTYEGIAKHIDEIIKAKKETK